MYPAHIACQYNSDIQWVVPGVNTVATKITPQLKKQRAIICQLLGVLKLKDLRFYREWVVAGLVSSGEVQLGSLLV